jgi:hypothetical protein
MSYTKLPAIKGSTACLTCGCGSHDTIGMERIIGVGFGDAGVMKDGDCIWNEGNGNEDELWQVKDAEVLAVKEPDCDWRIYYHAPLYDAEYQRQGEAHWVLVSKGLGFA